MRGTKPWLSMLVAAAVVVAACGDSGETTTSAEATATTEATDATTAPSTATEATDTTTAPTTTTTSADGRFPTGPANYVEYPARCGAGSSSEREACQAVDGALPPAVSGNTTTCEIVPEQIVTPATGDFVQAVLRGGDLGQDVEVRHTDAPAPPGLNVFSYTNASASGLEAAAAAEIRALGIPAAPHYLVIPTPSWKWGPANDAVPAPADLVDAPGPPQDATSNVTVIDTGLDGTAEFSADQPPGHIEPATIDPHYRGHGLFVAGVVRQAAPGADIVVRSPYAFDPTREDFVPKAPESAVWAQILAAEAGELAGGGVLNISGGTYACSAGDIPLLLAAATAYLGDKDIVMVASAGNDGLDGDPTPDNVMYPAGFSVVGAWQNTFVSDPARWQQILADLSAQLGDESILDIDVQETADRQHELGDLILNWSTHVVGVGAWGALSESPAAFSNQTAVSVYATGEDVVSNYPGNATWQTSAGEIASTGAAQWDGTSFAAPWITGLIAAERQPVSTYSDAVTATLSGL